MSLLHQLKQIFSKKLPELRTDKAVVKKFRKRYGRFRKLLDANAELADLLAELNDKLEGKKLFGFIYVRHLAGKAIHLTRKMATSLEDMHTGKYVELLQAVATIEHKITTLLGKTSSTHTQCDALTLPLAEINLDMVDSVGGKCANLGEMYSKVHAPIPRGFAITTTAFRLFFDYNDLGKKIEEKFASINLEDRKDIARTLEEIRHNITTAPLPNELEIALKDAWKSTFGTEQLRIAVRSSAQTEDGDKSFAGQFLTELNVTQNELVLAYRRVIASLFTPSATIYRLHQGISLEANAMAVACLEMVDATASGVAYSHDPVNLLNETIIINGIWGLGRYLVDGIVPPDMWLLSRDAPHQLIRKRAGNKNKQLIITQEGKLTSIPVVADERHSFSLNEQQVQELSTIVMRLEKHYGCYQDIEWAITKTGELLLLQSRPLDVKSGRSNAPKPPLMKNYPLLMQGGDIAYAGIGYGPVVIPKTHNDLIDFPEGGVLVATHSNAEYAAIVDKAQAIVTETGGVTGHMATICREFHVPALLNIPHATTTLQPGTIITVDALSGRIYAGIVQELLPLRMKLEPVRMKDTPVHATLKEVAKLITPLNLTDLTSAKFSPAGCETLHDVMRYAHEQSYHEMFAISDSAVDAGDVALSLKAPLPIDLYLIDLDKGTDAPPNSRQVTPEQITSAPLKALLKGMLRPDVVFRKPRPINLGGMMSVMSQQMGNPQGGDMRFGDKSYAIISDRYMNFSSRVGYHYSVLDTYCGDTLSKNYISFSFQGGAAGEVHRERRCRAIALVLEELGFMVTRQSDMVKSRLQKYEKAHIEHVLDQLGRLLQVTRQMDMLMINEDTVVQFKNDFMNEIYK